MSVVAFQKCEYIIDYLEVKEVKRDLSKFAFFYLEYRLGSWYLCHYTELKESPWFQHSYEHDFELVDPARAVLTLGHKLKGYRSLHNNDNFPATLIEFLQRVESRKKEKST